MKIAHITATFPPYPGGTGAVCYNNALHLARRGHDVHVFTANHPPGNYTYPAEITVHRLPVVFRVGNAPLLPGLFGLQGFDLVHLHFPFIFGQEIVYLKSLVGHIRYVITYHQDVILSGLLGQGIRLHETVLGKYILLRAHKLLFTSMDYAYHSRLTPLVKSYPQKVGEMPNGVDADRFRPGVDGSALRKMYNILPDDRVVLFVGGLDTPHYFKGVDVLLRSMSRIVDPTVKLLIVGDGDLRPSYVQLAGELGLSNRVIFCGRVPDELLPAHYAACDLLVLPSTTQGEAFGLVLLEAMATSKAVVASDLPGVRTVVDSGENGLLAVPGDAVDLAEKICVLMEDEARRRAMGIRGREKVESNYTWQAVVQRLEQVYEEVIADAAPHN